MAKSGGQYKTLDWDYIDKHLMSGCDGASIASHFGMHPDTLYNHVKKEKGMTFSAYKDLKYNDGNDLLKHTQYSVAIKGDKTMLVWLGKQRLGQSDQSNVNATVTTKQVIKVGDKEIEF